MTLSKHWISRNRKPQNPSEPRYPDGIDIDASLGKETFCSITFPHPTAECGLWIVECDVCNQRVMVTTAGRPDDPRSLKLACIPRPLS
jgi:hypothetical protein